MKINRGEINSLQWLIGSDQKFYSIRRSGYKRNVFAKSSVFVDEDKSRLPTLYWLPKLNYKSRLIANSSSCTTTELSVLLTSCLTAKKTCY